MSEVILFHFLVGHYTTHQPDNVHLEAHCSCGEKLEGVGQNESAAMNVHFDVENYICGVTLILDPSGQKTVAVSLTLAAITLFRTRTNEKV